MIDKVKYKNFSLKAWYINSKLIYKLNKWKLLSYLAWTSPIAISVAAEPIDLARFAKYCLNSLAQDCSSNNRWGEWVYHTDANLIEMAALSATYNTITQIVAITKISKNDIQYYYFVIITLNKTQF